MLTDCATVQATITARSVSEPRTYATSIAAAMETSVLTSSSGTSTVSDGPSRVAKMLETRSLVDQLAPKSPVRICWRKIQSWTT